MKRNWDGPKLLLWPLASQYDAQDLSKEKGGDECLWVKKGKTVKNSCKCNCESKKDVWEISTDLQPREKERKIRGLLVIGTWNVSIVGG